MRPAGCSPDNRIGNATVVVTIADLIVRIRRDTTLLAGTLIPRHPARVDFTRQPPVFLTAGERVSLEIAGIGRLTNPKEAA